MTKQKIEEMRSLGDAAAVQELERDRARKISTIKADGEEDKERIRSQITKCR